MATPTPTRPTSKRFLGNEHTAEVNYLQREAKRCQVDTFVRAGHAVVFTSDALSTAHAERYDNYAYCKGGSTR